jgi:hypothetical protein
MRVLAIAILASLLLAASGCAKPERPLNFPSTPEEIATAREFVVRPGMRRSAVEFQLGRPSHIGRTKEGYVITQYQLGNFIRTVVFDPDQRVVEVYP